MLKFQVVQAASGLAMEREATSVDKRRRSNDYRQVLVKTSACILEKNEKRRICD